MVARNVVVAWVKSSMCLLGERDAGQLEEPLPSDPVDPFAHPLVGLARVRPDFHQLFTASITSGHRGGLLGRNGMASLEKRGGSRALDTLPPTQIDTPSLCGVVTAWPDRR